MSDSKDRSQGQEKNSWQFKVILGGSIIALIGLLGRISYLSITNKPSGLEIPTSKQVKQEWNNLKTFLANYDLERVASVISREPSDEEKSIFKPQKGRLYAWNIFFKAGINQNDINTTILAVNTFLNQGKISKVILGKIYGSDESKKPIGISLIYSTNP